MVPALQVLNQQARVSFWLSHPFIIAFTKRMPITGINLDVGKKMKKALEFTSDDLRFTAERQRDRIVKRTGQGADADGNAFKAYTPAYAKRKAKSGRDSRTVDLNWSGLMLKALKVGTISPDPKGGSFTLGIYGSESLRAGVINEGIGKMPQRRFMGATPEDRQAMADDLVGRAKARAKAV